MTEELPLLKYAGGKPAPTPTQEEAHALILRFEKELEELLKWAEERKNEDCND